MTDLTNTTAQSRSLTAFFDTRAAADKALSDLVAAGVPRDRVRITDGATTGSTTTRDAKGFWEELKDIFMPDEDRYGYAEGLRRGGYLLSVQSDGADYDRVVDILDQDGAIDMDEREASWRQSGWTGYQAGAYDTASSSTTTSRSTASAGTAGLASATGTTGATAAGLSSATSTTRTDTTGETLGRTAATAETLREGGEEVIPVYEEQASVAKRDVDHGRVRLRSYVVETPFAQQVSLRSEQVQVERRPVDRAVGVGDAVFQDRVIEAEEHAEEAIIAKEARVKEEISLRKTVENQTQTVSDTLRHTEVEVEDTRSGRGLAGSAGAVGVAGSGGRVDASRIAEHLPVIASDGTQVGTVDHMDGPDKIKLAKTTSPDGEHHYIPLAWVDHVDTHVHLNRTSADVRSNW